MRDDITTLINRPYQEVVDDILTAVVGGVVNEPIIFDIKNQVYVVAQTAQDVRGITGTDENGDDRQFIKGIDYTFNQTDNTIIWENGGVKPKDNTTFFVDYFIPNTQSPLTDINVGSVTRTVSEAVGREIATVYQQINQAYLGAFVDTAMGKALDFVVAILGVTRKTKDFAQGLVTFFRDSAVAGDITIPVGTLLATTTGDVIFETTQRRTLLRGQVRVDVPVRATDDFKGEVGQVARGTITQITQAVAGISSVNNFEAMTLGAEDESDEDLRIRAKAALPAIGKGTIAALINAVRGSRGDIIELWDPNNPPARRTDPGNVVLLIAAEPERFPSIRNAVEATRAAGVRVSLVARYVFLKLRLAVTIDPKKVPTGEGQNKVIQTIIDALQSYVNDLTAGEPALGTDMIKAVEDADKESIKEVAVADVITWKSDVGEIGAETLTDLIMRVLATTPADDTGALRQALNAAMTQPLPQFPGGARIPDRSLVQTMDGERATDADLETGEFQVVVAIDNEDWWIALDMTPEDIALIEED